MNMEHDNASAKDTKHGIVTRVWEVERDFTVIGFKFGDKLEYWEAVAIEEMPPVPVKQGDRVRMLFDGASVGGYISPGEGFTSLRLAEVEHDD